MTTEEFNKEMSEAIKNGNQARNEALELQKRAEDRAEKKLIDEAMEIIKTIPKKVQDALSRGDYVCEVARIESEEININASSYEKRIGAAYGYKGAKVRKIIEYCKNYKPEINQLDYGEGQKNNLGNYSIVISLYHIRGKE